MSYGLRSTSLFLPLRVAEAKRKIAGSVAMYGRRRLEFLLRKTPCLGTVTKSFAIIESATSIRAIGADAYLVGVIIMPLRLI